MPKELGEENIGVEIPDGKPMPTPAEERAELGGWKPEAEWEGDAADWVDARQFNIRGELMGRITSLGKQLTAVEADNKKLGVIVSKHGEVTRAMTDKAYNKAVREMKMDKMEAVREGDSERVIEIEEEMENLKSAKDDADETPAADTTNPSDASTWTPQQRAWVDFVSTTPWAQEPSTHPLLLKHAEALLEANPNMPVGEFYGELERYNKPGKPVAPRGPDDNKGNGRKKVQTKGKYTEADLSPMEASIAEEFVKSGDFKNLDEYAQVLGTSGSLESQG